MVLITSEIQRVVQQTGVTDGLCHVWVPHTTAAVTVNENADPDVTRDLIAAYEAMIPDLRFAHAEGNSDAHLLTTLIGSSETIPVEGGRLCLGTWQGIYFVELDGPRTRKVWISMR
jgi:secondary thiamine-phosphate synthase enzyme